MKNSKDTDISQELSKALESYIGKGKKTRAITILKKLKGSDNPQQVAEQNGLFAPIEGDSTEYEVIKLTTQSYIDLKRIFMKSSNVDKKDKAGIAEEMGWNMSDFNTVYHFLDHYKAVCELLLKGYKAKENDTIKMPVVNRMLAFFLSGSG
mgnify:CR=1 FL=1